MQPTTLSPTGFVEPLSIPAWKAINNGLIPPEIANQHFFMFGDELSNGMAEAFRDLVLAYAGHPSHPPLLVLNVDNRLSELVTAVSAYCKIIELDVPGPAAFSKSTDESFDPTDMAYRLLAISPAFDRERHLNPSPFADTMCQQVLGALLAVDQSLFQSGGLAGLKDFWVKLYQRIVSRVASEADREQFVIDTYSAIFQRTYDQFNRASDRFVDAAHRMRRLYRDTELPPVLNKMLQHLCDFRTAKDDMERGRVYDDFLDLADETIQVWINEHSDHLHQLELERLTALSDLLRSLEYFHSIGEKLIQFEMPLPLYVAAANKQELPDYFMNYDPTAYLRSHSTLMTLAGVLYSEKRPQHEIFELYLDHTQAVDSAILLPIVALTYLPYETCRLIFTRLSAVLDELAAPATAKRLSFNPFEACGTPFDLSDVVKPGTCSVFHLSGKNGDVVAARWLLNEFAAQGANARVWVTDSPETLFSPAPHPDLLSFYREQGAIGLMNTLSSESANALPDGLNTVCFHSQQPVKNRGDLAALPPRTGDYQLSQFTGKLML